MKKLVLLFSIVFAVKAFAQNRDSLLKVLPSMKDEIQRLHTIFFILRDNNDFKQMLRYKEQMLKITRKQNDMAGESICGSGYYVALAGNMTEGIRMLFDALHMAERSGSDAAVGMHYLGLSILYPDVVKRKFYLQKAIEASIKAKDTMFISNDYINMASLYLTEGKMDSALLYNRLSTEITESMGVPNPYSLRQAGSIQYMLNRKELALQYWHSAVQEFGKIEKFTGKIIAKPQDIISVYNSLARYYLKEGPLDSSLIYARLEQAGTQNSLLANKMAPAKDLWKAYEKINTDSALKYAIEYYSLRDSVYNINKMQQIEAMAIVENEKQLREKEDRQHNLQYAAIALVLITFVLLFFLFSHSIIANQRLIEFLGILALLIVFEFINLFIHPYLDKLTDHSIPIMLGIMVCIAALLIPLHHKLEHWITYRLVEKNKKIRLTAAKKTIQQLEG